MPHSTPRSRFQRIVLCLTVIVTCFFTVRFSTYAFLFSDLLSDRAKNLFENSNTQNNEEGIFTTFLKNTISFTGIVGNTIAQFFGSVFSRPHSTAQVFAPPSPEVPELSATEPIPEPSLTFSSSPTLNPTPVSTPSFQQNSNTIQYVATPDSRLDTVASQLSLLTQTVNLMYQLYRGGLSAPSAVAGDPRLEKLIADAAVLTSRMDWFSGTGNQHSGASLFNAIALSQKIDRLDGVTITNTSISGYLRDSEAANFMSTSGGTFTGALTVSSSATSTFTGGIYVSALRTDLVNCDSLDTDSLGALICGVDASGGGGGSGISNLIYRTLSGTKYYTASSSASDGLGFHFNNGFVSSGASSTIADTLYLVGKVFASSSVRMGNSLTVAASSTFQNNLTIIGSLGASSTAHFSGNTTFSGNSLFSGTLGIGTSTPTGKLGVNGPAFFDSKLIRFASSSASLLTISYQARATTTILDGNMPGSWNIATSTAKGSIPIFSITTGAGVKATSSFIGGFTLDRGALEYQHGTGEFTVDNLQVGPMNFPADAGIVSWIDLPISTTTAGLLMGYTAHIASEPILTLTASSTTAGAIAGIRTGIATSSPMAQFAIEATSTVGHNLNYYFAVADQGTSSPFLSVTGKGHTFLNVAATSSSDAQLFVGGNVRLTLKAPGIGAVEAVCHSGTDSLLTAVMLEDCGNTPSADYAEAYPMEKGIEYGDIVAMSSNSVVATNNTNVPILQKSSRAYQTDVIGIVSNNYNDFTSAGHNIASTTNPLPVALNGRVPVKISDENGSIRRGDRITTSGVAGVGMKAIQDGQSIGIALEDFDGSRATTTAQSGSKEVKTGKILVFVNLGYAKLDSSILGDAIAEGTAVDQKTGVIEIGPHALNLKGEDIIRVRNILSESGRWSINDNGVLVVQEVHTQKLCVGSTCINESQLKELLDQQSQTTPQPSPKASSSAQASADKSAGEATPTSQPTVAP